MTSTMKWNEISQAIYYSGVGVVLFATSLRFIYNFIRNREKKEEFIDTLQKDVPKIKRVLTRMAEKMDIDVDWE